MFGRAPALVSAHTLSRDYIRWARILAVAAVLAAVGARLVVTRPDLLRGLLAAALALLLVALCFRTPRVGVLATLTFLPFLAFTRRLLIEDAGWPSNDPLLLVGPIVVFALVIRLFVMEGRPLAPDRLSKLILALVVIATIQVFNPAGLGLTTGVTGLMFVLGPLLWFFVGRELADDALVRRLLVVLVVSAAAIAVYGLLQSESGLPFWDTQWLEVTSGEGYTSLEVDDALRPWGTFSSSLEYALWLGAALTVAVALALHRSAYLLLALPVIAAAVFVSGTRAALLGALFGIAVIIGLRTRRGGASLVTVVLGVAIIVGGLAVLGPRLQEAAGQGGNDLVQRQVGGATDPFSEQSTLGLHWELLVDGVTDGFTQPLGSGTGTTGRAFGKAEQPSSSDQGGSEVKPTTEVDLSDMFRSFGLVGGLIYLLIILGVCVAVVRAYGRGHVLALAIAGVLICTFGQWMTGGHYALGPLTWLLVGWLTARASSEREREPEPEEAAVVLGPSQGPAQARA